MSKASEYATVNAEMCFKFESGEAVVSAKGGLCLVLYTHYSHLTPEDALRLAAWIKETFE